MEKVTCPQNLMKSAIGFRDECSVILNEKMMDCLQVAVDVLCQEILTPREGFQSSDEFAWLKISFFHSKMESFLSVKHKKVWGSMYAFLLEKIGNDVIAQENARNECVNSWSEEGAKNDFMVVWSMPNFLKEKAPDIKNVVYPLPMKTLVYGGNSGWGNSGKIDLPENATYWDVWSAADKLVRQSGDNHHIFLEGLNLVKDGVYMLSLGS